MPLTDIKCRNTKPTAKAQKLFDGGGLHLHVAPSGRKTWRIAYRYEGKPQTYVVGLYPDVTLEMARGEALAQRKLLKSGRNPQTVKTEARAAVIEHDTQTLAWLAEEWIATQTYKWTPDYLVDVRRSLEIHVLPILGARPIRGITPMDLVGVVKPVVAQGKRHETVRRICQRINGMMRLAKNRGLITTNPAADLKDEVPSSGKTKTHLPALKAAELPDLFAALGRDSSRINELGCWLLALTALRTGPVRRAEWSEVNWDERVWVVPAAHMKRRKDGPPHLVPLSDQAVAVLRQLQRLTGHQRLMFPGRLNPEQPMSENTLLQTIYRIDEGKYKGEMCGHGFRTVFSTAANEKGLPSDHIEAVLAHEEEDDSRRPYNRAEYIEQRRTLLQWWGDRLDDLTGRRCHTIIP